MKQIINNCIVCSKALSGKQIKFCSYACKQSKYGSNSYSNQKKRALDRKLEFIASKGNKCSMCGYTKNISALEFHHLDPSQKEFRMDSRKISNTTMDKLKQELDKCILVCSNCHREIHNPTLNDLL